MVSSEYAKANAEMIANETLVAGFGSGNPFNWVVPNETARAELIRMKGQKEIIADSPQFHLLFEDDKDGNNSTMIGCAEILHNKDIKTNKDILTNANELQQSIWLFLSTILKKIWNELNMALKIDILYPYRSLCFDAGKALIHKVYETNFSKKYWYIGWFCINPKFGKKGYGSKMLKLSHEKIKEYQLRDNKDNDKLLPIMLWAYNPYALKLYTKHGYKIFIQINVDKTHKMYGLYYEYDTNIEDDKIVIDLSWADLFPELEMNKYGFIFMAIALLTFPLILIALFVIFVLRLINIGRWDVDK